MLSCRMCSGRRAAPANRAALLRANAGDCQRERLAARAQQAHAHPVPGALRCDALADWTVFSMTSEVCVRL